MKTSPNDLAFPANQVVNDIDGNFMATISHSGMTLRQYYIGQALAGLCVQAIPGGHNTLQCMVEELPEKAVAIADALIELLKDEKK